MKPNLKAIEQDWNGRGFSCGVWVDPPGQRWENYRHDVDELFMVIEGKLELEMGGQKETAGTGKEIFIPKQTVHSVRNIGGTTAKWLYGYRRVTC